ncbi:MAG: glycosyltransferase family 4 protein, partial [Candidatus Sumerlaeia bacterium]|nr:glycosyltransferase family 4 protein [Candidatus Sumerlaeia bacterium]
RGTVYPLPRWSLERLAYSSRRIKKIIAVAQAVKIALIANKIPPEKIEVIYGGVDEKKFNPGVDGSCIRQEFKIKPEERVITSIGALVAKKGLTDLLQAVTLVTKTMPAIKLLIVGSGKREKLSPYLHQSLSGEKVIFTGHRQDIPEIIAASDLVVCAATKGEGLTGALREALAMKKPVITTDVAGNSELVIHENTGLVVPPANPEAMARAILRLLCDKSLAQKLAEQGYQLVRQKCLNAYRTEMMESLYYKLVGYE